MRLTDKTLNFIVNFLLGASWAYILVGSITSFLIFYKDTFFAALVAGFLAAIPGMVAILVLEHLIVSKEKLYELKKQSKLLERLCEEKETSHNLS